MFQLLFCIRPTHHHGAQRLSGRSQPKAGLHTHEVLQQETVESSLVQNFVEAPELHFVDYADSEEGFRSSCKPMKSTKELLRDKREGASWTTDEMSRFVEDLVRNKVSSAQIGAFLMAVCCRGLTDRETADLTLAMSRFGDTFPRGLSPRPCVDKHSTGGVGDKVSLLLAPLAVACGLRVPMISGRGLGHTGGTLDKLESVLGLSTQLTFEEMLRLQRDHHLFMAGQTEDLVPADRITYAVRDVTGTVENTSLITASILSKKLAEGLDGLVMDMKVGSAAFLPTLSDAYRLAESMQSVCKNVGLPITFVFTRMDQPLGRTIGNWLEIAEAELALATYAQKDLAEVTTILTAHMLLVAGSASSLEEALRTVIETWRSGAAHVIFHEMISRQGGRWADSVAQYATFSPTEIRADSAGTVDQMDARALAIHAMEAGSGRLVESDVVDPIAGLVLLHKAGDVVDAGEPLAQVYAADDQKRATLAEKASGLIKTTTAPVHREPSMIIDTWS